MEQDVAIIGCAGRFPGAPDLAHFWQMLCAGRSSARLLNVAEMAALAVPERLRAHPDYVPLINQVDGYDCFDAAFFGFTQREAEVLDPQRRMLFECVFHAFEDAGQVPGAARTGTYLSTGQSEYFLLNLASHPELFETLGGVMLGTLNGQDFAANHIAYKLNLQGPALNINTACSSSHVALHVAVGALLASECDLAVAGGASLVLSQRHGYVQKAGGINSVSGVCRPFDSGADGTVPGSGAGAVLLKRLADALRDGDPIRAVIRSTAVNNDGARKVGFTAPSVSGQVEVIREALAVADLLPDQVGLLESHGTGTLLGDAVEASALTQVFGGTRANPLVLGALKANVGHMNAAAGVAALIKTVLSLEQAWIPPVAGLRQAAHGLEQPAGPIRVPLQGQAFAAHGQPRIAAVSSFGIGGSNAHAILAEAPPASLPAPSLRPQVLPLAAASAEALAAVGAALAAIGPAPDLATLADRAYTLALGRRGAPFRRAVVACDPAEAALTLAQSAPVPRRCAEEQVPTAWLIGGQGEACLAALHALYHAEPAFRQALDVCRSLFELEDGADAVACSMWERVLGPHPAAEQLFPETAQQQPLLFAFHYALCQLWLSWGVRPDYLIGHSLGEYVAACVSGVLSLADAVRLVSLRARLMQQCPPGAMLAVGCDEQEAGELAALGGTSIALVNGKQAVVLAGAPEAVAELEQLCRQRALAARPLALRRAFHTRAMEPILDAFGAALQGIVSRPGRIPMVLNLDASWLRPDSAPLGSDYWLRHACQPVRFHDSLQALANVGPLRVLTVSAGNSLGGLARDSGCFGAQHWLADTDAGPSADPAVTACYGRLGSYWESGGRVDWVAYYRHEQRRKCRLPGYPFARQRHWIAPATAAAVPVARIDQEVRQWCYEPVWLDAPVTAVGTSGAGDWLLWSDGAPRAAALAQSLRESGARVLMLVPGTDCVFDGDLGQLDPENPQHLRALERHLDAHWPALAHWLWWHADPAAPPAPPLRRLLALADGVIRRCHGRHDLCLTLVAEAEAGTVAPVHAALAGVLRVLPQEIAGLRARLLVLQPDASLMLVPGLLKQLQAYLTIRLGPSAAQLDYAPVAPSHGGEQFRAGGRYLVIGGLGRVGRVVTSQLARHLALDLIIVGRQPVVPSASAVELRALGHTAGPAGAPLLGTLVAAPWAPAAAQRQRQLHDSLGQLSLQLALRYAAQRAVPLLQGCVYQYQAFAAALCATPALAPMVDTFVRVFEQGGCLARDGDRLIVMAPPHDTDTQVLDQVDSPAARRLLACATRLETVLMGGVPVDNALPDDAQADVAPNPSFERAAAALADLLLRLLADPAAGPLRILEIGGGDGALTRLLVPQLAGRAVEYVFSDSRAAVCLEAAHRARAQGYGWFSTRALALGADPLEQGFVCGEFDLIIGHNALQCVPDLGLALARLALLLKPAGTLALVETVQWLPWNELVRGLDARWWRFEDRALRSASPLLSAPEWRDLLQAQDFGASRVVQADPVLDSEALLVAAAPGPRLRLRALAASPFHQRRADHLDQLAGGASQVRYWQADLGNAADTGALGRALDDLDGPLDGVLYAATTGNLSLAMLGQLQPAMIDAECRAKVDGLLQVQTLVARHEPRFVAVMSSMAAVLGGIGHAAYAAANAWQDAFCCRQDRLGATRWLALNWDGWADAGEGDGSSARKNLLSESEAVAALQVALVSAHHGQLLISRHPLQERMQAWLTRESAAPDGAATPAGLDDALEVTVGAIWKDLLGRSIELDSEADFFRLGGDSLLALQLMSRMRKQFGTEADLARFMRQPTLGALVRHVQDGAPRWSARVTLQAGGTGTPLFCVHPGGGGVACFAQLAQALGPQIPVHALQAHGFGPPQLPLHGSVEAMASAYLVELKQVQPDGPYLLLGYCFGGMVALEMMRQLEAGGAVPGALVIVDGHPPGVDDGYFDHREFLRLQLAQLKLHDADAGWLDRISALAPLAQAQAIGARIDWGDIDPAVRPGMVRRIEQIMHFNHAKNAYLPTSSLASSIRLLRIDDPGFHRASNSVPDLGWGQFAQQPVEISWLTGQHLDLMDAPDVPQLVATLLQTRSALAPQPSFNRDR